MSALKTSLAALGATAALALAPGASAQSYDYNDCKRSDKDAQVVGGLVGGLIGAVAGHEIAGRGDTTEGAVVGAIAGAAAGAAIGDDRRNCSEEVYGVRDADLRREAGYRDAAIYDARHPGRGYHRHDRRDYRRDYRRDHGYRNHYEVRAQIERLKNEDRRLKRRAKYRWEPWIERRRDEIRWEVKRLKRIEDRLEDRYDRRRDRWEDRRDYREDRYYRRDRRDYGARHYHGSTVCYADH